MRILLLSDIHANLEALDAALAGAPPFDVVVNLGDIVGYGASPNEVAERSRKLGKTFVRGNHDKAATGVMDLDDFNPMAAAAASNPAAAKCPRRTARKARVAAARVTDSG